jgi:hypothetical protein
MSENKVQDNGASTAPAGGGHSVNVGFDPLAGLDFDFMDYFKDYTSNPRSVLILVAIILLFYFVFTSLGGSGGEAGNGNGGSSILEALLWAMFIVIVLINGFQYMFNTNLTAEVRNLFSFNPQIDLSVPLPASDVVGGTVSAGANTVSTAAGIKMRKQVFHIPANVYDYSDAKAVCNAYGARLANYFEVEEAHQKGGEWCSYGWSDNQMILYPTQKSTWEELQKGNRPNQCGHPGVNGGYMENAKLKFGVNCYGDKPGMNAASSKQMSAAAEVQSAKMINPEHEQKVRDMKTRIDSIVIAPFNKNAWSLI